MIYTIGYVGYDIDAFINVLLSYQIRILIDVRSNPYSLYKSDFSKGVINLKLKEANIQYLYLGQKLGGKPKNKTLYIDNIIDYTLLEQTKEYKSGINEIVRYEFANLNICLMCAEKDPVDCHRSILIGKSISNLGLDILHIFKDAPLLSQRNIENILMNKYYPNYVQVSLFDEENNYDSLLLNAYIMQNRKIGAKLEGKTKNEKN